MVLDLILLDSRVSFSSSRMDSEIVDDYIAINVCRSYSYSILSLIALFIRAFIMSSMGTEEMLMSMTVNSAVTITMLVLSTI